MNVSSYKVISKKKHGLDTVELIIHTKDNRVIVRQFWSIEFATTALNEYLSGRRSA